MANQTVDSDELLDELRRIGADSAAKYYVVVPASPIETGVAAKHGPLDVMVATEEAARGPAGLHVVDAALGESGCGRRVGRLPAVAGAGQRGGHVPPGSDRDLDAAA